MILVTGAVCAAAAPSATAGSVPVDATCTHTASFAFTPGLGLAPKPTTFVASGSVATCVSSQVTSGTLSGGGSGNLSCLGGAASGTLVLTWTTPTGTTAQSVVTLDATSAGLIGAGLSGTVTSGLFLGDTYTVTFAVNPLQVVRCVLPGGHESQRTGDVHPVSAADVKTSGRAPGRSGREELQAAAIVQSSPPTQGFCTASDDVLGPSRQSPVRLSHGALLPRDRDNSRRLRPRLPCRMERIAPFE